MTISPEWVQMMARYNAWQNGWMVEAASGLSDAERRKNRGAFFGGISQTLSHLLWGDLIWMSRFDGGEAPEGKQSESPDVYSDWGVYRALRNATDLRIENWANGLGDSNVAGYMAWVSTSGIPNAARPKAMLFTHFFNHQTHHRGQVHAMLTAAGAKTKDTDLFYMDQV